jgi:hypothetical protein
MFRITSQSIRPVCGDEKKYLNKRRPTVCGF